MAAKNHVPPAPFGRIFTGEAAAFLAARGGEAIFKVVPQQVIDTCVDILPAGILSTPDRQKDFARYAKVFALLVFRGDVVKAEIVQEFLVESLEEIANRKDEYESGRGDKKKSIVQEALNKRASKLDKLRAAISPPTAPGRNLWDTLAVLPAYKQVAFWDWFKSKDSKDRDHILDIGSGIVVTEERLLSFIDAPPEVKVELMKNLLDKNPRLGPSKGPLERFLGDVRGKGGQYLDPEGAEMADFKDKTEKRAKERKDKVRARGRMF